MLKFTEFSPLQEFTEEALKKLREIFLKKDFSKEKEKILGISEENGEFRASHWVGIVWIKEGELAVRVEPKRGYSVEVRMLEEC